MTFRSTNEDFLFIIKYLLICELLWLRVEIEFSIFCCRQAHVCVIQGLLSITNKVALIKVSKNYFMISLVQFSKEHAFPWSIFWLCRRLKLKKLELRLCISWNKTNFDASYDVNDFRLLRIEWKLVSLRISACRYSKTTDYFLAFWFVNCYY